MREHKKEWKDTLFWTAFQINSQMIKHLGYFFIKIIIKIQLLTSIESKI